METQETTGINGIEKENGSGAAGATGASAQTQQRSPYEDFYVVVLEATGIAASTSLMEAHIMKAFYRLNREQKSKLEYLKVKFYRECAKLATFRLDRKYVLHKDRLQVLKNEFDEIKLEFVAVRNEIYKELAMKWDDIVNEAFQQNPNLGIPREDIEKLRPTSPTFTDIDAHPIALASYIKEREGLNDLFNMQGGGNSGYITAKIKEQYEERIKTMQERIDKLKRVVKKKGTRYEQATYALGEEKQKIEEIADLLGEKDAASMRLEGMLSFLTSSAPTTPAKSPSKRDKNKDASNAAENA